VTAERPPGHREPLLTAEGALLVLLVLAAILVAAIVWGAAVVAYLILFGLLTAAVAIYLFGDRMVRLWSEMIQRDEEEP
jgi:fatty acid desaturase